MRRWNCSLKITATRRWCSIGNASASSWKPTSRVLLRFVIASSRFSRSSPLRQTASESSRLISPLYEPPDLNKHNKTHFFRSILLFISLIFSLFCNEFKWLNCFMLLVLFIIIKWIINFVFLMFVLINWISGFLNFIYFFDLIIKFFK